MGNSESYYLKSALSFIGEKAPVAVTFSSMLAFPRKEVRMPELRDELGIYVPQEKIRQKPIERVMELGRKREPPSITWSCSNFGVFGPRGQGEVGRSPAQSRLQLLSQASFAPIPKDISPPRISAT